MKPKNLLILVLCVVFVLLPLQGCAMHVVLLPVPL